MTEQEIKTYCGAQGIPLTTYTVKGKSVLRVMDTSQLPQAMREQFDPQGVLIAKATAKAATKPVSDFSGDPLAKSVLDSPVKDKKGPLPDGFPGKAALEAAGHKSYEKVLKLRDKGTLTDVPGIGETTAEHINEELLED